MIFAVVTAAVLIAMSLVLVRGLLGPTVYDRILAVNNFGTKTILMIALMGFLADRPDFLDIALLYALINFVATIAILKFIRLGGLSTKGSDSPGKGFSE